MLASGADAVERLMTSYKVRMPFLRELRNQQNPN